MLDVLRHFFGAGKPVAALCHGQQILATAGVLDDYEMTASPAVRAACGAAGCSGVNGVTRDGNLVTGQAWPGHDECLAESLDPLGTEIPHGEAVAADD